MASFISTISNCHVLVWKFSVRSEESKSLKQQQLLVDPRSCLIISIFFFAPFGFKQLHGLEILSQLSPQLTPFYALLSAYL